MPTKKKRFLWLMLASLAFGCSSVFYKEQTSLTGIYWIADQKAIELDLLFLERNSFNPLDGTTVKKEFRTAIKLIDTSQNPVQETLLTTLQGQLSVPGSIDGNTISLTDNQGVTRAFTLKTDLSLKGSLNSINKANQYLYRESTSSPIEIKQRDQ